MISLNQQQISDYLNITPPFLMVERIESIIPGKSAIGFKCLDRNCWFFDCHLPKELAMPGTLLIEAMLQTLVLTIYTTEVHKGYFSFVNDIKTKLIKKVSVGTDLRIEAELQSFRRGIAKGTAFCTVAGDTVCEGAFSYISPHLLPRPMTKPISPPNWSNTVD